MGANWTKNLSLLSIGLMSVLPLSNACGPSDGADETPSPTPDAGTPTATEPGSTETPTATDPGDTPTPTATQPGDTPTPTAAQPGETPTPPVGGALSASVRANAGCDLSAVVTWTTDVPASSWVEFGAGTLTQRIGSDALTTDHEVVVIGMYAEGDYYLQAVSETADGEELRSTALPYETGALPYTWMATDGDVLKASKSQGGWTLYNTATDNTQTPVILQMVDMTGQTIWYYIHDGAAGRLDSQVTWMGGEVLFGPGVPKGDHIFRINLEGEEVWAGPTQLGSRLDDDGTFHHVTEPLDDGGVMLVEMDRLTYEGVEMGADVLKMFNAENEETWSWASIDHTDALPLNVATLDSKGDWLHINSAALDPSGDAVYFSSLKLQQVIKVDKRSGEVLWKLGQGGDFAADPDAERPWFGLLHAMEALGDNRFMVYDNSDYQTRSSRALMYELDEETMQATLLWAFGGEEGDSFFNNIGGDADLLGNGNFLVVGGSGASGTTDTRLMEVTPEGEVVWQVWTTQGETSVSVFQADRFEALAQPL